MKITEASVAEVKKTGRIPGGRAPGDLSKEERDEFATLYKDRSIPNVDIQVHFNLGHSTYVATLAKMLNLPVRGHSSQKPKLSPEQQLADAEALVESLKAQVEGRAIHFEYLGDGKFTIVGVTENFVKRHEGIVKLLAFIKIHVPQRGNGEGA